MKSNPLAVYRRRIDRTDKKIAELLTERFALAKAIGAYKKENGLPVLDTSREANVLSSVKGIGADYGDEIVEVYQTILRQSKAIQEEKE